MSYSKKINFNSFTFNRVVGLLTVSDVFTWGGFYVVNSLVGIYLAGKLGENVIEFVGIGSGIYFLTRGLLQIPIGMIADRIKRDRDDIFFLVAGCVLMGLPYIFYPQIEGPAIYFVFQFIFGLGTSMNLVNWRKLFARNIDPGKEGFQYGVYETVMSISTAVLTATGGLVAMLSPQLFDLVIVLSGITMMAGGVIGGLILVVDGRKTAKL